MDHTRRSSRGDERVHTSTAYSSRSPRRSPAYPSRETESTRPYRSTAPRGLAMTRPPHCPVSLLMLYHDTHCARSGHPHCAWGRGDFQALLDPMQLSLQAPWRHNTYTYRTPQLHSRATGQASGRQLRLEGHHDPVHDHNCIHTHFLRRTQNAPPPFHPRQSYMLYSRQFVVSVSVSPPTARAPSRTRTLPANHQDLRPDRRPQ